MAKCKSAGCNVSSPSKLKSSGYCDRHKKSVSFSASQSATPNQETLLQRVADLEAENASIKTALKTVLVSLDEIRADMNGLKSSINVSNYRRDELEQYGRKESLRVIDVPEEPLAYNEKGKIVDNEDCAQIIIDAADTLGVKVEKQDIQRAHRMGKKKGPVKDPTTGVMKPRKPRQIIVRFKDYNKRLSIVKKKKNLQNVAKEKNIDKLKNAFIVEDLTQLRSKLLWYAKNQCSGKFINCHTKEGKILAQIANSGKDEWVSLSNPDDFHQHGIDVNVDVINKNLHRIQILKDFEFSTLSNLLD